MGPLEALVQAYDKRRQWTLELPNLGIPGCARHGVDVSTLPPPDLSELNSKTKDPHVLCVETVDNDGSTKLIQLISPLSHRKGIRATTHLVQLGVHPLDIIIATLDLDSTRGGREPRWTFRNSVDWMFWTHDDQKQLEAKYGGQK